ncbi:hypothetical protein AC579_5138 [Pseudocercospora musae]|uniref:mRNA 3'-end-processing protein RNA14 n=1 Tax=Pseudocercospora musae TaxID=113226 RepID=A0A139INX1_9PEZI|nr:hypothetical protein AC579_5138 [Pseudocercospora musae]
MADEYDPSEPPQFDAADDGEDSYDPNETFAQDGGDEDDDYDPSSVAYGDSAATTTVPTPTQAPPAPKPPQTVAGFIVEESDDEEQDSSEPPAPSEVNGNAGAHSGLGAVTASEAQDVLLRSEPHDTATPTSTSLNGSTTVPVPASTTSPTAPDSSLQPPAPGPASEQGKAISPAATPVHPISQPSQRSKAPSPSPHANQQAAHSAAQPPTNGVPAPTAAASATRLPHDRVGQLEDRIKDDPKGDTEAWLALIQHYVDKDQYQQARDVYARFFKVFPTAVSMYIKRIQMENDLDERDQVAVMLNESLMNLPNVDIWKFYLDHVRRALPLINDTSGQNRGEILKAFELTLDHVGIDPDAGIIWSEYIEFIKDGPGRIGETGWQDLQKQDTLRKAYQRAVKLPHSDFMRLWKEYETFEMGLHKANGRKHIQEQSAHYMQARTAKMQLEQKLAGLDRRSFPRLPPIYGCQGEDEFGTQVEKWRSWVAWERDEDPLAYKDGSNGTSEEDKWRQRVLYVYKQATMALCFYPEIWFEAASWCFSLGLEDMDTEGKAFLDKGMAANPESVLLAMMKADRVESSLESGNTDEVLIRNGEKLDAPYEAVHTALYALRSKTQEKDKRAVAQIQEYFASLPPEDEPIHPPGEEDDSDIEDKPKSREEQMKEQIDAVKAASAQHMDIIKRTISYVWVAKMRAFRRVQGQGKPTKKGDNNAKVVKGFRGIFGDARPRGPLSSDVYIASALMEWQCYRDQSAVKIFERGMKLFPTDEAFILEYIKHLISIGDITNARVVFESTLPKITGSAEFSDLQKKDKCRALIVYMHDFESKYGDLAQIHKIEKRMSELYPDEPEISRFSGRFSLPTFDAMNVQLVLSPTQAQPKVFDPAQLAAQASSAAPPVIGIEAPRQIREGTTGPEILLGPNGPYVASPKRPLDDSDADTPQRKFMRGESPMKTSATAVLGSGQGAVRMVSQSTGAGGKGGFATKTFVPANAPMPAQPPGAAPPGFPPSLFSAPPLPPQIDAILRLLPNAAAYGATQRFDPAKLVSFVPTLPVEQKRALFQAGQLHLSRR